MDAEVIAECRDYDELLAALRKRLVGLRITLETLDEISGLPARYCAKVLGHNPIKGLGPISTGPILGGLGVKIVLVEDTEALEKIRSRLVEYSCAGTSMLAGPKARKSSLFRLWNEPEMARLLRQAQLLRQSPRQRRAIARNAALARWGTSKSKTKRAASAGRRRAPRRNVSTTDQ